MTELKYKDIKDLYSKLKSVQSINPCKSVIQTIYDIVKAHGGVPIAIAIKVKTKYVEGLPAEASAQAGTEFMIQLPNNQTHL
jgi:hypothetical protein